MVLLLPSEELRLTSMGFVLQHRAVQRSTAGEMTGPTANQSLQLLSRCRIHHTSHPTGASGFSLQQIGQIVETACSPASPRSCAAPRCPSALGGRQRKKPCRSLCEKVKSDCDSVIRTKRSRVHVPPTLPPPCEPITVPLARLDLCSDSDAQFLGTEVRRMLAWSCTPFTVVKVDCSPQLKRSSALLRPRLCGRTCRPPCRTLCEQARSGCESLMNKFGFQWPESLSCEKFTTESCQHSFLCSVYTPECVRGRARPPCRKLCEQARSGCESVLNEFGSRGPRPSGVTVHHGVVEQFGVSSSGGICEPITIPMCHGLSYNETIMPNLLGTPVRGRPWVYAATEKSTTEMLSVENVLAKLNAGGLSVHGKVDHSRDLDTLEAFKLEHYVAVVRREYFNEISHNLKIEQELSSVVLLKKLVL
ncbi:hypothetical protein INR49_023229 [Caranx melampygus]|nr:hypothetical protein INR49_023229 [Caranx melampygus]